MSLATSHTPEGKMSYTVSTLLLRTLHDVFGEIDPVRRRAAIDEIFHENAVFHEPNGIYRGRDEIDRIAGVIKATHPDFRYQPLSPPEVMGDGGRVRWVSGSPGRPPAYAGTERIMRTGTVASVDNRNWELGDHVAVLRTLSQSRAIALDMESATIAANGFRFRVPYGTLLCVSDKPLHGEIKLASMASEFYRKRIARHLEIGLKALEKLKCPERERLHSRKLRSLAEVAFQ